LIYLYNPFECSCQNLQLFQLLYRQSFYYTSIYSLTLVASKIQTAARRTFIDEPFYSDLHFSCLLQQILTIASYIVAAVVCVLIAVTIYKKRWSLKWLVYKLRHGLPNTRRTFDGETNTNNTILYDIYMSYHPDQCDWIEHFVQMLEQHDTHDCDKWTHIVSQPPHINWQDEDHVAPATAALSTDDDEHSPLLSPSHHTIASSSNQQRFVDQERPARVRRVYYEDRDAKPDGSVIGQMCEAIFKSRDVIVCVSCEYLRDARRQFELVELVQTAMMDRYGYAANSHVILITLGEVTGELIQLLPKSLSTHFSETCVVWAEHNSDQQRVFWAEIDRRLSAH
jgi:hypothetical protein